jgi:putative Mn2+ efflux pump MntP
MLSIVLIGISLSMDACAVSVSAGVSIRGLKKFYMIRSAFFCGLFQFIMPVMGYYLGKAIVSYIEAFDHWVAFALLAGIGGKMLYEALLKNKKPKQDETGSDIRSLKTLLVLAVATSIDALAVGISLSMMSLGIWLSATLIGGITFVICLLGFEFGKRIGLFFEKGSQIAGGIILIAIGVKILLEHLL